MSRRLWWRVAVGAVAMVGALAWPTAGAAQTVVGNAKAVKATKFGLFGGTTTTLAGTGALGGPGDCLDANGVTGSVSSLLSGEVLRAVTTAWTDQVASEASLASLGITVAGTGITADFVQASAVAVQGEAGPPSWLISHLPIHGAPIDVARAPNQNTSNPPRP